MGFKVLKLLMLLLVVGLMSPATSFAGESVDGFRSTSLPLPRFVSLRSDKVYVRAGPALRYPIRWIYKRDNMPVEIVEEYENWRKVRGVDGEEGWIHQSLLSGERTVLIKASAADPVPMREGFSKSSRMVAKVEPMVVADVDKCSGGWCRIAAGGYRGWVERNFLWGIYEDEELN